MRLISLLMLWLACLVGCRQADPSPPINLIVQADGPRILQPYISFAELIVEGMVKETRPARWTTADGLRPRCLPPTCNESIYTPIVLEVQTVLKGQVADAELVIYTSGGQVGEDKIAMAPYGITFRPGDKVILLLNTTLNQKQGTPRWGLMMGYVITPDGQAVGGFPVKSARELLDAIKQAPP